MRPVSNPTSKVHKAPILGRVLPPDGWVFGCVLTLLLLGILMVSSASIAISSREYGTPFHYAISQSVYVLLGAIAATGAYFCPMRYWQRFSVALYFFGVALLVAVLIPGVGRTLNGSTRWLSIGGLTFQASEWMKLGYILYLARYMDLHREKLGHNLSAFLRPMLLWGLVAVLLLREPDFGAMVVLGTLTFGMLFMGGVPLRWFIVLVILAIVGLFGVAIASPYRIARLTTFLDPWANPFDSGYQLIQALIAFGRGEWFGVGLGSSVQKLFYLPEAHSDFLFAVIAEELGLFGGLGVLTLYMIILFRGMGIARNAYEQEQWFSGNVAFGISFWLITQAFINIGVNIGLLPTKGLTLPLMSAGGSSLLIVCLSMGILLRVDRENRASGHWSMPRRRVL